MRIDFKSLVILSRTTTHFGSTAKTTTVYDMRSVRDHTLDIPGTRLLFHPGIFWRVAVFAVLPILLLLIWTEGAPQHHPVLVASVLGPWCALFYFVAYIAVKIQQMQQFARQQRGLSGDTMIDVVENAYWDKFVAKLQCDPLAVGLTDLQRRLKEMDLKEIACQLRKRLEQRATPPDQGKGGNRTN